MPGYLTHTTNDTILDCLFGGRPLTPPRSLYVGLSLAPANRRGLVLEPGGTSYARVGMANTPDNFSPSEGGFKTNVADIGFPPPDEDWGLVLSCFVADAPEGGTVLAIADLAAPKEIKAGDKAPEVKGGALAFWHS